MKSAIQRAPLKTLQKLVPCCNRSIETQVKHKGNGFSSIVQQHEAWSNNMLLTFFGEVFVPVVPAQCPEIEAKSCGMRSEKLRRSGLAALSVAIGYGRELHAIVPEWV